MASEVNENLPMQTTSSQPVMTMTRRGIAITTVDELRRFCDTVAKSGLAPKGMDSPAAIAVAIEMGMELGLPPMAALQNIAVINGRPAVFGDAALAVCKAHPAWDEASFCEEFLRDANGNVIAARCTVRRKPGRPIVREFSLDDAKRARLFDRKDSPWLTYPTRMLQMRARSWALRDAFPDVLKGLAVYEEVQDIPVEPAIATPVEVRTSRAEALAERLAIPDQTEQVDEQPTAQEKTEELVEVAEQKKQKPNGLFEANNEPDYYLRGM